MVLVGLAALIGACGADQAGPADVATTPPTSTAFTTTTATTTTAAAPSTTGQAVDPKAVEDYLVALANLDADLGERLSDNETRCNEAEPDAEEPTQEQLIEGGMCNLSGLIDGADEHATALRALTAPGGFETAHAEYVDAIQASADQMRTGSAGFTTSVEINNYLAMVLIGIQPTPAFEAASLAVASGWSTLEQLGNRAGYSVDLGCPREPVEEVAVDVLVGGPWQALPNPLAETDGDIRLTLTNVGDESIRPVVISVFEGDPTNLPIVDGVVDLSLSGITDPDSDFASFGVAYPDVLGEGDSKVGDVPTLAPGETADATMFGGSEVIVIIDYRQGEFEAGNYLVIGRE